jgi:histidyl-tRNA synthetase
MFYESRCYRYERPQKGRYREFTQMGVEILGGDAEASLAEAKETLVNLLDGLGLEYRFDESVRRGLSYYTSLGFEVVCDGLGAQKQVAGGGPYDEGVGWAIGVDRLLLALDLHQARPSPTPIKPP